MACACAVAWALGGSGAARAATTTYSGTFAGPIATGDTAVLLNGASITGDVTNDGTLELSLSDPLSVTNAISGSGNVLLTWTGTVTFSGSNSYLGGTTIKFGDLVIAGGGQVNHAAADMIVGDAASDSGFLTISGGSVSSLRGILGNLSGSEGTASVTGGSWTMSGDLDIGREGSGVMTLSSGSVSSVNGVLGRELASSGTASVTGGSWAMTSDLDIGFKGTGALTVSGGIVTTGSSVRVAVDAGSSGSLVVSSGTLAATSVVAVGYGGTGTMLVSGGLVSNENGYVGNTAGSVGTATVTSGTWLNTGDLYIGLGGSTGTLNISGSGVVVVGDLLDRDTVNGTINLSSGGTLVIGTGGSTGTLQTDLTNDGTLIFDRSDFSSYGYLITGTGTVIKRGAGTLQFTNTNSYSGGTTILDGEIEVAAGGAIDHASAALTLGDTGGAVGRLTVNQGAVTSGLLDVVNGTFSMVDGTVQTGTSRIGALGSGTATISGGVWNAGSLFVGTSGTGTLNMTGGTLTTSEAVLGQLSGDSGSASITDSAIWNSSGNLTVGGAGTGVLTIATGGQVVVTGTLSKGSGGTINLNSGGELRIGNGGTTGALATDLTNNGLVVFNRSNDSTYSGAISGGGTVTKLGTGRLTLSGSNSYTGATNVDEGTLYVVGQLGNSAVTVANGALLGGSGSLSGTTTVNFGGELSPGTLLDEYATLSVGGLVLNSGAKTSLSISGTTAGLDYDQIAGTGASPSVVYGGDLFLTLSGSYADYTTFHLFSNFTSPAGDFESISLTATGPYNGLTFTQIAGVWLTGWTSGNQRLQFNALTGDLVVVPEPTALALAAVGAGVAGVSRWRRRRGHESTREDSRG